MDFFSHDERSYDGYGASWLKLSMEGLPLLQGSNIDGRRAQDMSKESMLLIRNVVAPHTHRVSKAFSE